ncbi:unnamed protein product [Caenorhabditis auriculariae]|uniref:Glycylpeptide N-tetradecanoyltransferase n=1 Tax=Caenorhabditis auriculariae TaxID=2777116 RepID=A0A8S1HQT5_9PELO|nr:unnamed protein product [Caenorhabditis auriculariae]
MSGHSHNGAPCTGHGHGHSHDEEGAGEGPGGSRPSAADIQALMDQLRAAGVDVSNLPNVASAPRHLDEARSKNFQFWSTQPVPNIDETVPEDVNTAIEPDIPLDQVRGEPYTLPDGFEWCNVDLNDDKQLNELYTLLTENYVEDEDAMFRFDYAAPFLKWALQVPGWLPQWHCGVRAKSSGRLLAFIGAVPQNIRVYKKAVKMVEINFLCVHKKLRSKRVAPVLIREITRRVNQQGIFQAAFTAGIVIPKPVSVCRYWHRSLNPKKLVEVRFSHLSAKMTLARTIKLYKLPNETATANLRPMEKRDVPKLLTLLTKNLEQYSLAPIFATDEEIEHTFLPRKDVVFTYVVQQKNGELSDMVSFYSLPSTVMGHPAHKSVNAAYLYYYVAQNVALKQLINDALILAHREHFDVFNALDLMRNNEVFKDLKFGIGDGNLQYYLYNWKCADMKPEQIVIDVSGCFAQNQTLLPQVGVMHFRPMTEIKEEIMCNFMFQVGPFQRAELSVVGQFIGNNSVKVVNSSSSTTVLVLNETYNSTDQIFDFGDTNDVGIFFILSTPIGIISFSLDFNILSLYDKPKEFYFIVDHGAQQFLSQFYLYSSDQMICRLDDCYWNVFNNLPIAIGPNNDTLLIRDGSQFEVDSKMGILFVFAPYEHLGVYYDVAVPETFAFPRVSSGSFTFSMNQYQAVYRMFATNPYDQYSTSWITDITPIAKFHKLAIYANCAIRHRPEALIAEISPENLDFWTPIMLRGRCWTFFIDGSAQIQIQGYYAKNLGVVIGPLNGVLLSDGYLSEKNDLIADSTVFRVYKSIEEEADYNNPLDATFTVSLAQNWTAGVRVTLTVDNGKSQETHLMDSTSLTVTGKIANLSYSIPKNTTGIMIRMRAEQLDFITPQPEIVMKYSLDYAVIVYASLIPVNSSILFTCDGIENCNPMVYIKSQHFDPIYLSQFHLYSSDTCVCRLDECSQEIPFMLGAGNSTRIVNVGSPYSEENFPNDVIFAFAPYELLGMDSSDRHASYITDRVDVGNASLAGESESNAAVFRMIEFVPYNPYATSYIVGITPIEGFQRLLIYANCAIRHSDEVLIANFDSQYISDWVPVMLRGSCWTFYVEGNVQIEIQGYYSGTFGRITRKKSGVLMSDGYLSQLNFLIRDSQSLQVFKLDSGKPSNATFSLTVGGDLSYGDNVSITINNGKSQETQTLDSASSFNSLSGTGLSAKISYSLLANSTGVLIRYNIDPILAPPHTRECARGVLLRSDGCRSNGSEEQWKGGGLGSTRS